MFDLEESILKWRGEMLAAGLESPDALDELESHLRDDVARQTRMGIDQSRAFENAVQQIGRAVVLKKEFAKDGGVKWAILGRLKAILLGHEELPSFEDFSPAGVQILALAPEEARCHRHNFVGTEHLLLGLIKPNSGTVSNVMTRLGLDAASVRKEIENAVRNFPVGEAAGKIPFTPRARRALQLAADEAQLLNQPTIGAEHIFLGLILEGDGVAARILKNLGIGLEKAREETMTEMRANPGAS